MIRGTGSGRFVNLKKNLRLRGTCIAADPPLPFFPEQDVDKNMLHMSQLTKEIVVKGYTVPKICRIVNDNGVPCTLPTFRLAIRDGITRNRNQQMIYDEVKTVLAGLPMNPAKIDSFVRKCRERNLTVCSVWQYYNTTREKKYSWTAFSKATETPMSPFEFRLREEAYRCLDEMVPSRT